jgi:hypothetical protein
MWPSAFTQHPFGFTAVLPAAFQPKDTPLIWFEIPESELDEIFRITWSGDGEILNQESLGSELVELREHGYPSDAIFAPEE